MSTFRHPRLPNVTVEVGAGDEGSFKAQGWVDTDPEPAPTPEPAFDEGGTLEPGLNEVRNDTGEPESLVRPKRTRKK